MKILRVRCLLRLPTSKEYTAAGTIELGKDASVLVTNHKNYKVIKAEKQWKDSKKSDGTGEENSDFPDLEDDLKPESTNNKYISHCWRMERNFHSLRSYKTIL